MEVQADASLPENTVIVINPDASDVAPDKVAVSVGEPSLNSVLDDSCVVTEG